MILEGPSLSLGVTRNLGVEVLGLLDRRVLGSQGLEVPTLCTRTLYLADLSLVPVNTCIR